MVVRSLQQLRFATPCQRHTVTISEHEAGYGPPNAGTGTGHDGDPRVCGRAWVSHVVAFRGIALSFCNQRQLL